LVDEPATLRDLLAGGAEQGAGGLGLVRGEEDAVPRPRTDVRGQTGLLLLRDVLGDRPAQLPVLTDGDVGQTLGAALLRPLLPSVELAAGLAGAAGHDHGPDVVVLEDAEGG